MDHARTELTPADFAAHDRAIDLTRADHLVDDHRMSVAELDATPDHDGLHAWLHDQERG